MVVVSKYVWLISQCFVWHEFLGPLIHCSNQIGPSYCSALRAEVEEVSTLHKNCKCSDSYLLKVSCRVFLTSGGNPPCTLKFACSPPTKKVSPVESLPTKIWFSDQITILICPRTFLNLDTWNICMYSPKIN